jgi:alpha-tubulin suppressor-like RCC1 family protein
VALSISTGLGCTLPDAVPGDSPDDTTSATSGSAGGGQGGNETGGAGATATSASGATGGGATGGGGAGGGADACLPAQVTARGDHSCARSEGGTVWCWGNNEAGQVGEGTSPKKLPQEVTALGGGATEIAAGGQHTCALQGGAVWCWGSNEHGQLGNGQVGTPEPTPQQVDLGGATAVEIAIGFHHGCARKQDDTVSCWGRNDHGQLGNASTTSPLPIAVDVSGLAGVAKLSAGTGHTCALKTDETVWCWGRNDDGQLGNGVTSTTPQSSPVQVTAIGGSTAIAAGGYHTCAVSEGAVWCWGKNTSAQVGSGSTSASQPVPAAVAAFASTASHVWAGALNTCVRQASGALFCFGYNVDGQAGNDTTTSPMLEPALVGNLGMTVVHASVGYHTCALQEGGHVWCWGRNDFGQLGDNSFDDEALPVPVTLPCP